MSNQVKLLGLSELRQTTANAFDQDAMPFSIPDLLQADSDKDTSTEMSVSEKKDEAIDDVSNFNQDQAAEFLKLCEFTQRPIGDSVNAAPLATDTNSTSQLISNDLTSVGQSKEDGSNLLTTPPLDDASRPLDYDCFIDEVRGNRKQSLVADASIDDNGLTGDGKYSMSSQSSRAHPDEIESILSDNKKQQLPANLGDNQHAVEANSHLNHLKKEILPSALNGHMPLSPTEGSVLQAQSDSELLRRIQAESTSQGVTLDSSTSLMSQPTSEQLTKHLNQYLSQGLASGSVANMGRYSTTGTDLPSQITMELTSLQPEVLAQNANYQSENYVAHIKVHPLDMGEITAKIEVNQGNATITFMTEHMHVKQLMENNLTDLHNAFQNANLNLASVNINNNSGQQEKKESTAYPDPQSGEESERNRKASHKATALEEQRKNSIIDTYA